MSVVADFGIVGLAIGRELTRRRPGARVVVFDKEDRVAAHQTGHNSGVVHAGIYYQPGSLKARPPSFWPSRAATGWTGT
jgi:L-2-hydroxyglutarate oxidase LhgO